MNDFFVERVVFIFLGGAQERVKFKILNEVVGT
jgi:hypothetical protein